METYPRLSKMGVLHPHQIARYSVNSFDYVDYLRIFYARPKGSLLPLTRNYQFPRKQNEGKAGSVMESSAEFREAVAELDQLLAVSEAAQGIADEMLSELQGLEEDIAHHAASLRELIEKIKKARDLAG